MSTHDHDHHQPPGQGHDDDHQHDGHPDHNGHQSYIEGLLRQTAANIGKFGWQVLMFEATDYLPSFACSIGLYQTYSHPEIICFGLDIKEMHVIINDVAAMIRTGEIIRTGHRYMEIFQEAPAEFLQVADESIADYFGIAIRHYKDKRFPALQLVWPDESNKFPWEEGFEEKFRHKQPLLDRNADFKFRESRNLGVFTTRQWLEEGQPILYVFHDEDGDWQFLTGDQTPEDATMVALSSLITKDPTLNQVFNLDYGEYAERTHVGGEWVRDAKTT